MRRGHVDADIPEQILDSARYITHQPDGVCMEARFTCGEKLEGVGQDQSEAMGFVAQRAL